MTNKKRAVIRDFSISGDLIPYRRCGLQYRHYGVDNLPRSDVSRLWASNFIEAFEKEAYHAWCIKKELGVDRNVSNELSRIVNRSLRTKGLIPNPISYEDDPNGVSEKLMNLRAYDVLTFLVNDLFPLICDNNIAIRYRDSSMNISSKDCDDSEDMHIYNDFVGFSIYDTCGLIRGISILEAPENNPIRKAFGSDIERITNDSEVLFQICGMNSPLNKTSGRHEVLFEELRALMEMRNRNTISEGPKVVAGILLFLNELHISKRMMKAEQIRMYDPNVEIDLDDMDAVLEMEDGNQPSWDYRLKKCIKVEYYDQKICSRNLGSIVQLGTEISTNMEQDIMDPSNLISRWEPGQYDEILCSSCDFRYCCPEVPLEKRYIISSKEQNDDTTIFKNDIKVGNDHI